MTIFNKSSPHHQCCKYRLKQALSVLAEVLDPLKLSYKSILPYQYASMQQAGLLQRNLVGSIQKTIFVNGIT